MLDRVDLAVADDHVRLAARRSAPTSLGMSAPSYWLSASVLTITSAPSFRPASRPAWKRGREPLVVREADDVVDAALARATSTVRSVEPSSMTSHSTASKPGDLARQVGERQRQLRLLVEARDLDDQLH